MKHLQFFTTKLFFIDHSRLIGLLNDFHIEMGTSCCHFNDIPFLLVKNNIVFLQQLNDSSVAYCDGLPHCMASKSGPLITLSEGMMWMQYVC